MYWLWEFFTSKMTEIKFGQPWWISALTLSVYFLTLSNLWNMELLFFQARMATQAALDTTPTMAKARIETETHDRFSPLPDPPLIVTCPGFCFVKSLLIHLEICFICTVTTFLSGSSEFKFLFNNSTFSKGIPMFLKHFIFLGKKNGFS